MHINITHDNISQLIEFQFALHFEHCDSPWVNFTEIVMLQHSDIWTKIKSFMSTYGILQQKSMYTMIYANLNLKQHVYI